jgi:hypothetical protein
MILVAAQCDARMCTGRRSTGKGGGGWVSAMLRAVRGCAFRIPPHRAAQPTACSRMPAVAIAIGFGFVWQRCAAAIDLRCDFAHWGCRCDYRWCCDCDSHSDCAICSHSSVAVGHSRRMRRRSSTMRHRSIARRWRPTVGHTFARLPAARMSRASSRASTSARSAGTDAMPAARRSSHHRRSRTRVECRRVRPRADAARGAR